MEMQIVASTVPTAVIDGDCTQVLPLFPAESAEFILTDPPYLCRYMDRSGRQIANDDQDGWLIPAFREMYRVLKNDSFCVSFYGWHRVDAFMRAWRKAGFSVLEHLVFIKSYDSSRRYVRRRHEQAYLLAKGCPRIPAFPLADVMEWRYTGNRLHPTQKPVTLMESLIDVFSLPGDLVLDPFCGSGTTLIAARDLGRRCVGIEIDPKFAEVARQRLAA